MKTGMILKVPRWGVYLFAGSALLLSLSVINRFNYELDLTENRRHSLSEGGVNFLSSLERTVTIRYYLNQSDNILPITLRNYAEQIDNLLNRIVDAAGGKVRLEKLDPQPDSTAEESALIDGISGYPVADGVLAYMGLSFASAGNRAVLPFLDPGREGSLEYDILSRIRQVVAVEKEKIGILSSLPILGNDQFPPWYAFTALRERYELVELNEKNPIPSGISTVLLVHPSRLSTSFEHYLDDYIARDGTLVVLMDSLALSVQFYNMSTSFDDTQSVWTGLERATGLSFEHDKAVLDMFFKSNMDRGQGQETLNFVLTLNETGINPNHPITRGLSKVTFPVAGTFTGEVCEGLKKTILLHSTEQARLEESETVANAGWAGAEKLLRSFQPDHEKFPLALLLEGTFRSFATGEAVRSSRESKILLVGDTDFLADPFAGQVEEIQGQTVFTPFNNNIGLLLNGIDYLREDFQLSESRARTVTERPLLHLLQLERNAEKKYENRMIHLESELKKFQEGPSLDPNFEDNQKRLMTPEFRERLAARENAVRQTEKELRELRRKLREDLGHLKSKVKWINIAVVPGCIMIAGWIFLRRRRKATGPKF